VLACPILLCTFHATKAWLEQLRKKLKNKTLFTAAFDGLYSIMHLKARGSREERMAAVKEAIAAFAEHFAHEPDVVAWVQSTWEPKAGVWLAFTSYADAPSCTI
jgi:hypothetical protein